MLGAIIKNVASRSLLAKCVYNYGKINFEPNLKVQTSFDSVDAYRCYDLEGNLIDKQVKYDAGFLAKMLKTMIFVDQMDSILLKVKGQGKISFYMTSFGEHASIIGSAAGLKDQDFIYSQYRQQGAFIWRGFSIDQIINQCIGNQADGGKGRQMPVHYGSKALNMSTVSSPLATQVPQAVGSGYGYKVNKQDKVCAVYYGEGAASEGDSSVALNFAATLNSQTLFFCRNNKYAISTPSSDQYVSDGIIPRAISHNIASSRVDGNDVLACYEATKKAREYIIKNRKPYFLEFMTYRVGDHSTSDNSQLYRSQDQRKEWKEKNDPIDRLTKFLKSIKYKDIPNEQAERKECSKTIIESLHRCQQNKYPTVLSLFDDVYDVLPKHLQEQREELKQHLAKYGDKYDYLNKYATD